LRAKARQKTGKRPPCAAGSFFFGLIFFAYFFASRQKSKSVKYMVSKWAKSNFKIFTSNAAEFSGKEYECKDGVSANELRVSINHSSRA